MFDLAPVVAPVVMPSIQRSLITSPCEIVAGYLPFLSFSFFTHNLFIVLIIPASTYRYIARPRIRGGDCGAFSPSLFRVRFPFLFSLCPIRPRQRHTLLNDITRNFVPAGGAANIPPPRRLYMHDRVQLGRQEVLPACSRGPPDRPRHRFHHLVIVCLLCHLYIINILENKKIACFLIKIWGMRLTVR
jgi:hypothetical protein